MAPKRRTEDPPAASSEEDEASTSTEEDGEEDAQTQTETAKKPVSSSDSESEPETDQPNNAPVLASKPLDATPLKTLTKPPPKPLTKAARSKPPPKRASEADADSRLTKKKTKNSEDNKKQMFERLWSEDDEIVLLEGIIKFVAENKADPTKNFPSFFNYIMKSVHFAASIAQLKDKVARMKKKFERHVEKNEKNGEETTFSNAHYQKSYDLSKLIWGVNGSISGTGKKIANNNNSKNFAALKAELGLDADKESQKVSTSVGVRNSGVSWKADRTVGFPISRLTEMGNYVAMKGMEMVDGHKKSEMEERWRKLQVTDLQLFIDRVDFLKEQAQLVIASYKE